MVSQHWTGPELQELVGIPDGLPLRAPVGVP
jgi:hypothetical protein